MRKRSASSLRSTGCSNPLVMAPPQLTPASPSAIVRPPDVITIRPRIRLSEMENVFEPVAVKLPVRSPTFSKCTVKSSTLLVK